jgi:predicted kinase
MISLVQLLMEAQGKNKAIIMAGAAGSGKTTFVTGNEEKAIEGLIQAVPELKTFKYFNPDEYIEGKKQLIDPTTGEKIEDVGLTKASMQIDNVDVPQALEQGENFIWDTTAANASKIVGGQVRKKDVEGLTSAPNYDFMMIMVYAHPIVSFLSNFQRERKVPKIGVISTWNNVYGNIDIYKSKLGDNFLMYQAPTNQFYEKEIKEFNKAVDENRVYEYLENIISQNPEKYISTFRKSQDDLSPEEIAKKEKQAEKSREQYKGLISQLEKEFREISNKVEKYSSSKEEVVAKIKKFIK